MSNICGKYAFVGLGLTKQGKLPEYTVDELATQAILLALEDSGIQKQEIDGYIYQPGIGGGPTRSAPIRNAGIPARFCWELQTGSASGISTVIAAIGTMEAGLCQACILVHATSAASLGTVASKDGGSKITLAARAPVGGQRSTWGAYGYFGPVAVAAWIAQRYMHLYGLTREQMGAVAMTLREYANKRSDAIMYDKKLTLDDYMNTRMVVAPMCLYDCCLVNDGAVAMIITSAERAKYLKRDPVYVMGFGLDHSISQIGQSPQAIWHWDGFMTRHAGKKAFEMAGISLQDVDVAEMYDAFSIFLLSQLESYGICGKGESGAFVAEGNLKLNGRWPSNTSGTGLSWAYLQGFAHITEGIRQLRGEAGECQVKDAEIAMVTGLGGAAEPAAGSSIACCILGRK